MSKSRAVHVCCVCVIGVMANLLVAGVIVLSSRAPPSIAAFDNGHHAANVRD